MPLDLDQLLTAAPRAQALTPTSWVSSYWLFLEAGAAPPAAVQPNGAVTMPAGTRRPRRGPGGLAAGTSAPLYSLAPTNQAQYLMPSRATRWRPQTRRREPLVLTGALNLLLAVVVEDLPAGKQATPSVVRLAPSKRHAQALGMPNTLTAPPPTTNQAQYAMPSRSLRWPARRRREYMHTPLGSYLDLLVTPFEMASALVPSKVVRRRDVTWRARSVTLANPLGLLLHPNDLPDGAQLTPLPAPLRRRVPRGLEVVPLPNLEPTPIGDPVVRANDFTRPVRLPRRAPLDHTRHNPLLLLTFTALPPAAPFTPTVVRRPRRAPLTWSSSGLLLLLPPTPIGDPPPGSQLTPVPVRLRDALRHWRSFAGYNAALLHDAGSDFAPEVVTYLLGLIPGYPDVIDLGVVAGYPDVLNLAMIPGYPDVIEVGDIARG